MRARLTVESLDGQSVSHELSPDRAATLGRSRDNSIVLRDEHASRLHAKIAFEGGRWLLRDYGLNGTRHNGQRIEGEVELEDGHEIRIGDTRMQFHLEAAPAARPGAARTPAAAVAAATTSDMPPDGLTALARLLHAAGAGDARELLRLALPLLQTQTAAVVVGYVSLDSTDPAPPLVVPEGEGLPGTLWQQIARRAQREGRTVRLGTDSGVTQPHAGTPVFSDGLSVPLASGGRPFAVLQAYRTGGYFDDRQTRLAEVLAGLLAPRLAAQRGRRALEAEAARLRQYLPAGDELVGDGPALQLLRQGIAAAAAQPTPVLLQGEAGVGKELAALALHRRGKYAAGPFVSVQCAGIEPSAFATELFGYARGAFRGAERDGPGLLDQAADGTLFLDEIADVPPDSQEALAAVLEGRGFRPLGARADRTASCRLVAATRRDLGREAQEGRFRADLFERLKATLIPVPPLRERREDVPALAQYFLDRLAVECRRTVRLTDAAVRKLSEHAWPGNVRELRAVLEAAVARAAGGTLDADALALGDAPAAAEESGDRPASLRLDEVEAWAVRQALASAGHDLYRAAALLDVTPDRLSAKLRQHRLAPADADGSGVRLSQRVGG
jgi:DNA-binding NtrC family response regulator